MKKLWLILGVFALAIVPSIVADEPIDNRAGRAEVRFLEGMIDHHQMALDMATHCLDKAESESVKTMCQNVIDAQSAEIELMRGWLLDWYNVAYEPMSMMAMMEGMGAMDHGGHSGNMPMSDPSMMMGMMAGLNHVEGREYDVAWLEAMIDHHDDALHMSERILRYEVHPETLALAQTIIDAQTAEIAEMEAMLSELSAE